MKDSILNIKNILKIIISVLIILSMLKSCARAETVTLEALTKNSNIDKEQALEEILSHYGYLYGLNNSLSNNQKTNWENYKRNWQNASYSMIYIWLNSNAGGNYQQQCQMYYVNSQSNNNISSANSISSNFSYKNATGGLIYKNRPNDSSFDYSSSTAGPTYQGSTFYYILVQDKEGDWYEYSNDNFKILEHLIPPFVFTQQGEQVTFQNESMQGIKKDNLVIPFNLGNIEDRNLYHNFIISISTNGTTLDTLNYYIEYNENSGKNYHKGMLSVTTNNNKTYILLSSPRLNFNQKYTLSIDVYRDTQTHEVYNYNYVFLHQNATINNSVITDYGSGDFSNQDIAISNEQNAENSNNMLQDLYDKAFSISGDFIQSKIEELKLNNNFSGDVEIEKAFIGLLSGDTQDFKISWNTVATHFTYGNYGEDTSQIIIPSGEVNFSKIERENEEFQEVMGWVRIILGFSFGAMLLRNYWTTLLETLGIGIQPYDSVKEEKAIMTDTIIEDARGEKTRQVRVTKGNKTYIKKYKMNNYEQIGGNK